MQRFDEDSLRALLARIETGALGASDAYEELRTLPFAALGDARIDHHRGMRTGIPEVVFGMGKKRTQVERFMRELHARSGFALATRVAHEDGEILAAALPHASYSSAARTLVCGVLPRSGAKVAVISAGTSDAPVAEEAAATADAFGHQVLRENDVGVAGLHRLLPIVSALDGVRAVIVVAGMEGALPSVVAGLVRAPVIAVPTSIGYGASFGGLAALLAMLSGCAPGVSVVNVDNGFGAACVAHKIVATTGAPA